MRNASMLVHVQPASHGEHDEQYSPFQSAMCKRWDTPIFAGHHQPLKVWILCLYFMGLNVSNEQIAQELAVNGSDAQQMTAQLREGIEKKSPR